MPTKSVVFYSLASCLLLISYSEYQKILNSYILNFLQSDGVDEKMKEDIDSVRGLLDRLKHEKERALLQEVTVICYMYR